eukprot:903320-Pleurochrysis_carterae.AAC.2
MDRSGGFLGGASDSRRRCCRSVLDPRSIIAAYPSRSCPSRSPRAARLLSSHAIISDDYGNASILENVNKCRCRECHAYTAL